MNATEVTRRYHDAWNGRDADALVAAFTKDGTSCNPDTCPALAEGSCYACKGTVDSLPRLSYRAAKCW